MNDPTRSTAARTSEAGHYLTIADAAEHLVCSEKLVRRMIADGKLKAVRVGRLIRIHPRDLEKALKPVTTYGGAA